MTTITTSDFNADVKVRDVSEEFKLYAKENRSIIGELLDNGASMSAGTNQKYEWLGSQLAPTKFTVNNGAGYTLAASPTTTAVTFDSTTGMQAGDVLTFKTPAGVDVNDSTGVVGAAIVDSVVSATVADLVVISSGGTITIADNTVCEFTRAEDENKKTFTGENNRQPEFEYNNFQILDQEIELSDTVINSIMYGGANDVVNQLSDGMYKIMQKMKVAMSNGVRSQRGTTLYGSVLSKGFMQGYQRYIDVADGNVTDASASALSPKLINDTAQLILEQGGMVDSIVCNYAKAREISAFNTSGSNPSIQLDRANTTAGSYVQQFAFDMPVDNGMISRIIIDDKVSNDKVYLADMSRIALVPYQNRGLRLQDATLPGQDGKSWVLRGEYTLAVKDAKYAHGVIKNLA